MGYYISQSTQLDYNSLANIPTPESTDSFVPIPHTSLVSMIKNGLNARNFNIVEEKYAIDKVQDMFGMLKMESSNGAYHNIIGIRNSHNKRFSASACHGSSVMVCDNLSFHGEHQISRKHTKYIMRDLTDKVSDLMNNIVKGWANQEHRFNAYTASELSDRDFNELLGDAIQSHAIQPSKALKVAAEYKDPRHDEFKPRNAWSAFNAFTEIYKESPNQIMNAGKRSINLHSVFDRFCSDAIDHEVMNHETVSQPESLKSLLTINAS